MSTQEEAKTSTPIREVVIDGLAVLKIVKHCTENLPTMVAGSLLGLDVDGVLEVTYSYAFPSQRGERDATLEGVDELDGGEYQIEMMRMLRDVNVDNNCIGWYQSMYLGTMSTNDVVNYQYSYQSSEELSENSVVVMYDPIQSQKGSIVMKAYRLADKFMELKRNKANKFIKPGDILEEVPVRIKNLGHVSAFLRCLQDSHKNELDCDFEPLSLSASDSLVEKHMELVGTSIDDLLQEQNNYKWYASATAKTRQEQQRWLTKRLQENAEAREMGNDEQTTYIKEAGIRQLPDGPSRTDHLLLLGQLGRYCQQVNEQVDGGISKLLLTTKLNSSA
ncbi:hypothetical protein B484DRAFT_456705 [Ochromonadaceae sp. CCMP2298]|nr:hypothetical protein B484DRAFT_456705 [Ochromonadaceae sp. CCMP2298]